jgi:hypothetical protein
MVKKITDRRYVMIDYNDGDSGLETVNDIPITELNAFRERHYPEIPVSVMVDYGLVDRGLEGETSPLGVIFLAPEITRIDDWQKLDLTINLTPRALCYLVLLHEIGHFKFGHTEILSQAKRQKLRKNQTVYEAVAELTEDIQATGLRLVELNQDMASIWAVKEYLRLIVEGVL